jgi:hypothetical protein
MMRIFVESVGVLAPGLQGWSATRAVLEGSRAHVAEPLPPIEARGLPPAERRRSSPTVRLAMAVAEEALAAQPRSAAEMAMVCASREAAGTVTHQLCEVLAGTREVSPTLFHNSVHNAPSGYCSIAWGMKHAAGSVCRGPWSFAAGLLNASAIVCADQMPVLFVAYDSPMPLPLGAVMPVVDSTAIALVLAPRAGAATLGEWKLDLIPGSAVPDWPLWMPASWHANATARGFSPLATLADAHCTQALLPCAPDLGLRVTRC